MSYISKANIKKTPVKDITTSDEQTAYGNGQLVMLKSARQTYQSLKILLHHYFNTVIARAGQQQ